MSFTIHVDNPEGIPPTSVSGVVITIGRVKGNDVVLVDPRVSSRHGRLVRQGDGYAYEDLGSRNGSLLERDGEREPLNPNTPVQVRSGDLLLLGDLVSPVVLRLEYASTKIDDYDSGTVIARRSVIAGGRQLVGTNDLRTLRQLFALLHEVSGQQEPAQVMILILDAVLEQFSQVDSAMILTRTEADAWTSECVRHRRPTDNTIMPSRTLIEQALNSLEIVSYIPSGSKDPASVVGLAGTVIVPLVSGQQVIGILHAESVTRPFGADALEWLGIVSTHVTASLLGAQRFRDLTKSEASLRAENSALRSEVKMSRPILGESESLQRSLKQLARVGRTDATVLVLGETGTGKELAARYVHAHSDRAENIFAPINCGALSEDLLNSELFGHKKGSFTGADRDRKGLFESADGGTIFLDEVGEVSPAVQVRLLRVLQEREVQPVGSHEPIAVNVRIVAATNRDLEREVKEGRFREDLYYRLAVFSVKLPPLRERDGDLPILMERFREAACARFGT